MTGEGASTSYAKMFNDAAPFPVPTFSNVHAAVEWAAGHARTGIDETLNNKDDGSEDGCKVSCDQLRTLLAKSGVAKLDVLITLKLNFRH